MTISSPLLPDGWSLERLRAVSGVPSAVPLSLDRVVVEDSGQGEATPLRPDAVLAFHDLCLVREDGDWYMGHLHEDGSVSCWASYGPDLEAAIRAL
ncbi:hypothetical protein DEJ50_31860 [Streptomyces venezuelae]|uniref:Uncharacterized protein n=1 Tax=Streptomyces venezuelae TaxID=54571 RepID=A0A5P2DC23_STRVZ|nr:hypothetical protein [Streptomyces venezuelae]QES51767.1 hypothetical protein DEJ50_31860 [Streptomyces venezuelae]